MGIDTHILNFLRYAHQKQKFKKTITIGRQGIDIPENIVRQYMNLSDDYKHYRFCEYFLENYFDATHVDSIDNSDFEQATKIADMNLELPRSLHGQYDTIFDGGCLEHIYNAPQALKNCSLLCKPGGQIIHMLPANNFCGHGFWQFSPELFFSLYSPQNGYEQTEIFLADLNDVAHWYVIEKPSHGNRLELTSRTPLYVLVRTVLKTYDFSHAHVQQSDYEYLWEGNTVQIKQPTIQPIHLQEFFK